MLFPNNLFSFCWFPFTFYVDQKSMKSPVAQSPTTTSNRRRSSGGSNKDKVWLSTTIYNDLIANKIIVTALMLLCSDIIMCGEVWNIASIVKTLSYCAALGGGWFANSVHQWQDILIKRIENTDGFPHLIGVSSCHVYVGLFDSYLLTTDLQNTVVLHKCECLDEYHQLNLVFWYLHCFRGPAVRDAQH